MREIPNFPGYYADRSGRVWSNYKNKFLSPVEDKDGYLRLEIKHRSGKSVNTGIHRLIAFAFVPNPHGKPEINHKDHNRQNNLPDNLEWATRQENENHKCNRPMGENSKAAKLKDRDVLRMRKLDKYGMRTNHELADEYPVTLSTVNKILSKRSWRHL